MPATYVVWPLVFVTERSTCDVAAVSVSAAVLLAVFVSVEPAPAVTVAVFAIDPVALGSMVPAIVSVSAWPAPGATAAPVKETELADEAFVPHDAVPVAAQLTLTPVIDAGTVSAMDTPVAVDGPAFVTVTV